MPFFPLEYFRLPGVKGVLLSDFTPPGFGLGSSGRSRGVEKTLSISPVLSRGSNVPAPVVPKLKRSEDEVYKLGIAFVLRWEGGYVNNPNDAGGATNKGVTQHVYDAYRKSQRGTPQDVKLITAEEVADIYRHRYWAPAHCRDLPDKLAVAHLDTYINGGGAVVLNRALGLSDKTAFGASTLTALANVASVDKLVASYLDYRDKRYDSLAAARPQNQVFLKGWHNRVAALRTYLKSI